MIIVVLEFLGEMLKYFVKDFINFFFLLKLFWLIEVEEFIRKIMLLVMFVGFGFEMD